MSITEFTAYFLIIENYQKQYFLFTSGFGEVETLVLGKFKGKERALKLQAPSLNSYKTLLLTWLKKKKSMHD